LLQNIRIQEIKQRAKVEFFIFSCRTAAIFYPELRQGAKKAAPCKKHDAEIS
jgi:hypothetical protein